MTRSRSTLAFSCIIALVVLVLSGCATPAAGPRAPVLLISLDGFRWDYLAAHPEQTPNLRALAARGVQAEGLIPVFPSNTFPNHYAIVTGLYPTHSGMVNNRMFDAARGEFFQYNQPNSARDGRWWGGEPIWATAVRQGRASACSFWPGSEAEIKGVRPTHWKPYNYSVPFEQRVDELVSWFNVPREQQPAVTTFYLEESNSAGHRFGPESPEVVATLKLLDDRIGILLQRFASENIAINVVVVSDHGMTECGRDRVLLWDDYIELGKIQIDFDETVGGVRPAPGVSVDEVVAALTRMPHARVYRAENLPAHLHIDPRSPRVPPIWVLPDEGWQIARRALFEAMKDRTLKGQHGYDPMLPKMRGIFIASGPAFKSGRTIPAVENIHIYNLLCAAAGLKPAANDGDNRLVKAVLR